MHTPFNIAFYISFIMYYTKNYVTGEKGKTLRFFWLLTKKSCRLKEINSRSRKFNKKKKCWCICQNHPESPPKRLFKNFSESNKYTINANSRITCNSRYWVHPSPNNVIGRKGTVRIEPPSIVYAHKVTMFRFFY